MISAKYASSQNASRSGWWCFWRIIILKFSNSNGLTLKSNQQPIFTSGIKLKVKTTSEIKLEGKTPAVFLHTGIIEVIEAADIIHTNEFKDVMQSQGEFHVGRV